MEEVARRLASAVPTAGALLAACGDGGGGSATATTAGPPVTEAPFDPSTPWWLQGNFAPVAREVEALDLAVTGEIPTALTGAPTMISHWPSPPRHGRTSHPATRRPNPRF